MSRIAVRQIAIALAIIAVVAAVAMLPAGRWLESFNSWIEELGPAGYLVYVLIYVLACVLLIPASPLSIGAGVLFGFAAGSMVVLIGATLGATASFLLARTVFRDRVERMAATRPRFRVIDRAIAAEGWRIVLLVRLAPIFPFAYMNFLFGLTGVRTLPYVLATAVGIAPATLAFVYLSASAATAIRGDAEPLRIWMNVGGAIAAVAASLWIARVAARAVRRAGVDA